MELEAKPTFLPTLPDKSLLFTRHINLYVSPGQQSRRPSEQWWWKPHLPHIILVAEELAM